MPLSGWLIVALVIAIGGLAAGERVRTLSPAGTVFVLVGAGIAVCLVAVGALALLVVGWLAGVPMFTWCRHLYATHHAVPWPLGAAAFAWLAAAAIRVRRSLRWHRSLIVPRQPGRQPKLTVVHDERARAFALPGTPGQVVVSTGMLRALSPDERRALIAHERAHLRHHHPSILCASDVLTAIAPPLWRLRARIRFAIERWADEEAARSVGERPLVAKALAHAALADAGHRPATGLAMADLGVPERVEALLSPRNRGTDATVALFLLGLTVSAAAASGAVRELHHLGPLIGLSC